MPSILLVVSVISASVALAMILRTLSRRKVDSILLLLSGTASLVLALVASNAMHMSVGDQMMQIQMSEQSFNFGFLPPVFIVATLTVMRGLFKLFQE